MTQALANTTQGAITRPQSRNILSGEEEDDVIIPRVHIMQGLPAEKEMYGKLDEGTFVNTVTGEIIDGRRFIPVFGWVEYIKFRESRGSGIEYRTRNKSDVPPEDLAFDTQNGKPPACTRFINFAVLFEGTSDLVVLSFKSTGIAVGKTLNTLEKYRGSKGAGLYEISLKPKKNAKGAWLHPQIRPLGDPQPDDKAMVEGFAMSMSPADVKTNFDQSGDEPGGNFDPNADR